MGWLCFPGYAKPISFNLKNERGEGVTLGGKGGAGRTPGTQARGVVRDVGADLD